MADTDDTDVDECELTGELHCRRSKPERFANGSYSHCDICPRWNCQTEEEAERAYHSAQGADEAAEAGSQQAPPTADTSAA